MNTKRLITASIFSLISASTALAADVLIPHQPASSTSSTIVAPTFSWTGLYLGVQAGGFSSKADLALVGQEKSFPLDKEFSPKLSGFAGGFYAGSNIDLGDSFIFGIDTDLMLSGKKHTKTITIGAADNITVENAVGRSRRSASPSTPQKAALESSAPVLPRQATSTKPATTVSTGNPASGAETSPAANGGTTVTKSTETRSNQTQARQVNSSQSPNASTGQPNQLARTDNSGNVNSSITVKKSGVSTPSPSSTPSSNTTSKLPETSSASSEQGARSEQSSSSTKTVKETPASSASSTRSETSQLAASTDTSGRSLTERTVPSRNLVLSRSKVSGSETNTSNGTSGAHGGYHSAHGGGYAYSHGTSQSGGHGSGARGHNANPHSRSHGAQSTQAADKNESSVYGIEQMRRMASELGLEQGDEVETLDHTFKQNWGGATRVRIGFAADRFMPYLAGGIAYGQFQDTISISVKDEEGTVVSSKNLTDETKTMIGYTLGGGVDFSVLDNVIVRAEYRYSDFGKKKFSKEKLEVNYKTNDFRVGVAYKF
ncbi:outer membrane protein [Bartonella tribocorum]|uniref:Porin n=1 Tax=Bartonella tribocorum (strain DSM 28219 / CCUG 45778 / CIP 105476 / IBS 506) TaxID=382640 RepID=A9IN42_BART1|nr:outer membrane protein [Bartonella tribocorum]CAK00751.1 hemin binding protein B [Bartonella tribocorum CIP 105476]CDO47947.1 hemin binding protein B [Bartonella tribocorum]